jgi:hypothetical protein
MSGVLGISVSSEGESNLGGSEGKVFVANHITTYDHFAINLATNAIMVILNTFSNKLIFRNSYQSIYINFFSQQKKKSQALLQNHLD